MNDKRKYQRFSFENNIILKFENDPAKTIEGRLLDISFGGLSIFSNETVDIGAIGQASVQFGTSSSAEKQLVGRSRVIHVSQHRLYMQDGFRLGLEFVEVDKKFVLNIINELRSKVLAQIRKKK